MSFNMIPNILVDSVVLPNKSLSNIEIIDAAKKLSLDWFRGVFCETLFLQKHKIKRMWYFKFRFIFWWWYTLGDVVKKIKNKFYIDSYGVQPPSELIAYLKSPLFYNSERVQQNGEMFCGHLCLFTLKQLSLGNNLQTVINYLI